MPVSFRLCELYCDCLCVLMPVLFMPLAQVSARVDVIMLCCVTGRETTPTRLSVCLSVCVVMKWCKQIVSKFRHGVRKSCKIQYFF